MGGNFFVCAAYCEWVLLKAWCMHPYSYRREMNVLTVSVHYGIARSHAIHI